MALFPLLADQLSFDMASLKHFNPQEDIIAFCEVRSETDYVQHHPQKIAFLFSAMRHFAKVCEAMNFKVHYVTLDDVNNSQHLILEWERLALLYACQKIYVTLPGEWRLTEAIENWQKQSDLKISLFEDERFLCSHAEFKAWAAGKKQLRMEFFYQMMRKKYKILLDDKGLPEGGRWNYDIENRQPLKKGHPWPARKTFEKDTITLDVIDLVNKHFAHHFGHLEHFGYACTAQDAHLALEDFINHHLPYFGQYQDVMVSNEPFLHHALISMYINVGFIEPLSLCRRVENLYREGKVPLASAEGFIRQVLGWREYVRGIYWLYMPEYIEKNFLNAKHKLPNMYWGGPTQMNCIRQVVSMTEKYAYSHHIQRLMITGNFALLAGIIPKAVCDWYLAVYIDAFEWVELPNTLGMALYGDGGVLASKPYAASARYIEKMSNFCHSCHFKSKEMLGEKACPFNTLYWNFMAKHEQILKSNPRMAYMYSTWNRFSEEKRKAILEQAKLYLERLEQNNL